MKILKTIRDSDIGGVDAIPEKFRERNAARGIVFDTENKIALFYSTQNYYHKLPGGGVEEGEAIEAALRRELLEEIGCTVDAIQELGVVEEYRNTSSLHQFSYGFMARVSGEKGTPQLEADEIEEGFETVWMDLDRAIETLEGEKSNEGYQRKFIQMRELLFLNKAKELVDSSRK